jgi:hypothetical protein
MNLVTVGFHSVMSIINYCPFFWFRCYVLFTCCSLGLILFNFIWLFLNFSLIYCLFFFVNNYTAYILNLTSSVPKHYYWAILGLYGRTWNMCVSNNQQSRTPLQLLTCVAETSCLDCLVGPVRRAGWNSMWGIRLALTGYLAMTKP